MKPYRIIVIPAHKGKNKLYVLQKKNILGIYSTMELPHPQAVRYGVSEFLLFPTEENTITALAMDAYRADLAIDNIDFKLLNQEDERAFREDFLKFFKNKKEQVLIV